MLLPHGAHWPWCHTRACVLKDLVVVVDSTAGLAVPEQPSWLFPRKIHLSGEGKAEANPRSFLVALGILGCAGRKQQCWGSHSSRVAASGLAEAFVNLLVCNRREGKKQRLSCKSLTSLVLVVVIRNSKSIR